MKFALYVLRHPIDGFWEMKYEKKGTMKTACVLLLLTLLTTIMNRQTRGFIFNNNYNVPLNIFYQIRVLVLPILLLTVANWAITTLLDGKGTLKEIFFVICYSLFPLIIFNMISPILSNIFSLNDAAYLEIVDILGIAWMCLMIFIGIQQIHEYSFSKMIGTLLLTTASAAVIIFICLLFFSLLQEIGSFLYSIYREITLRI